MEPPNFDIEPWTEEWPTEPGTYLFYGQYTGIIHSPTLSLCHAQIAGTGEGTHLMLSAGASFLFPSEQYGMFAKFKVDLPLPPRWREIHFYSRAYDILIEHAELKDKQSRESFIRYFVDETGKEWRFQGSLGFGGKFWHNEDRWYIQGYPEDSTRESKATIKKVNKLLAELRAE